MRSTYVSYDGKSKETRENIKLTQMRRFKCLLGSIVFNLSLAILVFATTIRYLGWK